MTPGAPDLSARRDPVAAFDRALVTWLASALAADYRRRHASAVAARGAVRRAPQRAQPPVKRGRPNTDPAARREPRHDAAQS